MCFISGNYVTCFTHSLSILTSCIYFLRYLLTISLKEVGIKTLNQIMCGSDQELKRPCRKVHENGTKAHIMRQFCMTFYSNCNRRTTCSWTSIFVDFLPKIKLIFRINHLLQKIFLRNKPKLCYNLEDLRMVPNTWRKCKADHCFQMFRLSRQIISYLYPLCWDIGFIYIGVAFASLTWLLAVKTVARTYNILL